MALDSLFYYRRLQWQKEEELRQLQIALASLEGYQEELISSQQLITQPELTRDTWAGRRANEFDQIRHDRMLTQYKSISHEQMENVISEIEAGIQSIQAELSSIGDQITRVLFEMEKEKAN